MIKENKLPTEYVTVKILEKTLDERFEKQDKRFDDRMDKRFEEYTKIILDAFDSRFDKVDAQVDELKTDINDLRTTVDNHLKLHTDSDQEFAIVKAEVGQMKQVFKQKIGVEIKAF